MTASAILHTEARLIARHAAFAGFSIPLEANDTTIPACPLSAVGADAAQLALCLGAASAADFSLLHATTNNQNEVQNNG